MNSPGLDSYPHSTNRDGTEKDNDRSASVQVIPPSSIEPTVPETSVGSSTRNTLYNTVPNSSYNLQDPERDAARANNDLDPFAIHPYIENHDRIMAEASAAETINSNSFRSVRDRTGDLCGDTTIDWFSAYQSPIPANRTTTYSSSGSLNTSASWPSTSNLTVSGALTAKTNDFSGLPLPDTNHSVPLRPSEPTGTLGIDRDVAAPTQAADSTAVKVDVLCTSENLGHVMTILPTLANSMSFDVMQTTESRNETHAQVVGDALSTSDRINEPRSLHRISVSARSSAQQLDKAISSLMRISKSVSVNLG